LDLLREKACRNINLQDIVKVIFQSAIGHVSPTFEVSGQSGQVRSKKTGFFNGFGNRA
jgi:hypothetical protein